ncbi:MAG: 30S ribosome-binding factor RbfA [Lachnospiraceae bacterium]|nr:30S ribosome-binding factor RbfA [Lachnospiraceae bacterium]
MRKNSIKNTRINAEVQKELANLIRGGIKDPRIAPMTCVTDVEVAPDLKTCKVYISVLGDETVRNETMEGLRRAEGFIRHHLATTLNLRNTPELTFISDTSTEYGMAMSAKIDEVMAPIHAREMDENPDDQ